MTEGLDSSGHDIFALRTFYLRVVIRVTRPGVQLATDAPTTPKCYGPPPRPSLDVFMEICLHCLKPVRLSFAHGLWLSAEEAWFDAAGGPTEAEVTCAKSADKLHHCVSPGWTE